MDRDERETLEGSEDYEEGEDDGEESNKEDDGPKDEMMERLRKEVKRRKALELLIEKSDGEIEDLEARLDELSSRLEKRGVQRKGEEEGDGVYKRRVKHIYTRSNRDNKALQKDGPEQRRHLEEAFEKERLELDLLRRLAELQDREMTLVEKEKELDQVEEEVEKYAVSRMDGEGIKAMRSELRERMKHLERRREQLDMIEEELDRLDRQDEEEKGRGAEDDE